MVAVVPGKRRRDINEQGGEEWSEGGLIRQGEWPDCCSTRQESPDLDTNPGGTCVVYLRQRPQQYRPKIKNLQEKRIFVGNSFPLGKFRPSIRISLALTNFR